MGFRLEQPWWLLLLILVVPVVLSGWVMLGSMSRLRRSVAIGARVALIVVLALLLAGISTKRRTNKLALVAVIDQSDSVREMAPPQRIGTAEGPVREVPAAGFGAAFIEEATRNRGGEDLVGAVVADERASVLTLPAAGGAGLPPGALGSGGATDLASALRLAAAIVPSDATGRIVVISDGAETAGDVLAASDALAASGSRTPVDVVPIEYDLKNEVMMTALDAPPRAAMGSTVTLRVTLRATTASSGVVRLEDEGVPLVVGDAGETSRRVELTPGDNVERFTLKLPPGRIHRFAAYYEPDVDAAGRRSGDTRIENNRAEGFTLSPGKGAVLLVRNEAEGERPHPLERTLAGQDIAVKRMSSAAMPTSMLELEAYDVVVLDDVPADEVATQTQELLASFVRDMGGGLVMIGGRNSFAAGGWKGSKLEPLLPVNLEVPDKVVVPETATVFVLDNSGSMGHRVSGSPFTQQQIANEAAALAVTSLSAKDLVGVVVFNSDADTVVPLAPNRDPQVTAAAIRRIGPDGGTNVAPGLEIAHAMLRKATAKVRHIVVMTDGRSINAESLPAMSKQIARDGIRITTIGVGDQADAKMLNDMAREGGGKYYQVRDPNVLPRVFLKAVRIERQPLIREGEFKPILNPVGSPMTAGITQTPALLGLSLAGLRSEPTVVNAMLSPEGEPLLAHWNAGLGQVVAFTSDADQWAEYWKNWEGYSVLWTQVMRLAARPPTSEGLEADASVTGGVLTLRLDATDPQGAASDGLRVRATVADSRGGRREVRLAQTGPGRYEAVIADPAPGANVAVISAEGGGGVMRPIVVGATVPRGAEYRGLSSNAALLRELAARTGGRVLDPLSPRSAKFFDRSKITPREVPIPLGNAVLPWVLAMVLFDIAVRRLAWDRWLPGRAEVAEAPARAAALAAGLATKLEQSVPQAAEPAIALGEADAKAIAKKAKDERMARKLAGMKQPPAPPIVQKPAAKDEPGEGGLMAAKRRAKERFEEE
ncbi:MAG: VWA domain-containing protein [Phycisphaerales bacterium]